MNEIYYYLLSVIFFTLASICNAMMDTLQFHWSTFRWKDKVNDQYWNPSISWRNKYINGDPKQGFKYKFPFGFMSNFLDAWHLFKSTSIFLMVFSIVCFDFNNRFFFDNYWLNQIMWVAIYGLTWIFSFNIFFNKILVIKNK
jgi:hypothetical protein